MFANNGGVLGYYILWACHINDVAQFQCQYVYKKFQENVHHSYCKGSGKIRYKSTVQVFLLGITNVFTK